MNHGRHRKKKDNKIRIKLTMYDNNLDCYITYSVINGKVEIINVKPR